jgi:hypothetical protein
MPTFFARGYARPTKAVGSTEKLLGLLILLLVVAVIAAFAFQVATDREHLFSVDEQAYALRPATEVRPQAEIAPAQANGGDNPFPDAGLEGWRAPAQVDRLDADNLYVEINGRAAAYLQHGCVGLMVGAYQYESDPDRAIDVYWYDMATPENALAMYRSEEAPDATPVAIGRAGYQVGGAVFFCKGSSYVQVMPTRLDDADADAALKIAERLAVRINKK